MDKPRPRALRLLFGRARSTGALEPGNAASICRLHFSGRDRLKCPCRGFPCASQSRCEHDGSSRCPRRVFPADGLDLHRGGSKLVLRDSRKTRAALERGAAKPGARRSESAQLSFVVRRGVGALPERFDRASVRFFCKGTTRDTSIAATIG